MSNAEIRTPDKPNLGAPCTGCGLCCAAEPCPVARDLGIAEAPCPILEFADGRFYCGLMRTPSRYLDIPPVADAFFAAAFSEVIGAGKGCDSDAPATGEFAGKNLWERRTQELAKGKP